MSNAKCPPALVHGAPRDSDRRLCAPRPSLLAHAFALCSLLGCATTSEPYVDKSRASVFIVRGYLESGKLQRSSLCEGSFEGLEVQCAPGPRNNATFVVEERFVGAPPRRLHAYFQYLSGWPEMVVGRQRQYLAALISDGRYTRLIGVAPVFLTADGEWAIPIRIHQEDYLLPCSLDNTAAKPLRFREPRPRESAEDLGYSEEGLQDIRQGGDYSVEQGYLYPNKGLTLEHVPEVYAGKSAVEVAGQCH